MCQPLVGPLQKKLDMPVEWHHVALAMVHAYRHGWLSCNRRYDRRAKTYINILAMALRGLCRRCGGGLPEMNFVDDDDQETTAEPVIG